MRELLHSTPSIIFLVTFHSALMHTVGLQIRKREIATSSKSSEPFSCKKKLYLKNCSFFSNCEIITGKTCCWALIYT
jgi:hypothetical protein